MVLIASAVRYHDRGGSIILYDHPDFDQHEQVIYSEPSHDEALKKIENLKSTIQDILKTAMRENRPTSDVANDMALQHIEGA